MTPVGSNNPLETLGLLREPTRLPSNELGQDQFLELMITQLRNQDPLNPLESAEFFSQIAQFSQVAGIQDLQASFGQVASALHSNEALQAATLVGRSVLTPSDEGVLPVGSSLRGAVELPASTGELALNVYDSGGQLVRRLDLGTHPAGLVSFTWDGITDSGVVAPTGNYQIEAIARIDDEAVAVQTLVVAPVESVTLGGPGSGITLNLTGLGQIAFSEVKQIL